LEARAALFFGKSGCNLLGEDDDEDDDYYTREEPDLLSDTDFDDKDVSNSQISDDEIPFTDDKDDGFMAMEV